MLKMSKQITYSPFIKESSYKYDTKVIHIFKIVEVLEVLGNEDREARCSFRSRCVQSRYRDRSECKVVCCLSLSPQRCCCWFQVQRLFHSYDVISFWPHDWPSLLVAYPSSWSWFLWSFFTRSEPGKSCCSSGVFSQYFKKLRYVSY